jgi:hypothetical protein
MRDKNWDRLTEREAEIDGWFKKAEKAVYDDRTYAMRRLEKTILIAAGAICEAIWKARY